MAKSLLVLGASHDQTFLIRTAQSMGIRVVAVDMNPDSVGFEVADEHAVVSTRDIDGLIEFIDQFQANGGTIAGVTTMGSDIPHIIASVASYLGTPSVSAKSAALATDKLEMKHRFRERGIPIPWYSAIHSYAQLLAIVEERGFPLVLKPLSSSGSRGVFYLQEGANLEALYAASSAYADGKALILEEYLPGPQISTETIMFEGKGYTPGFADRNYDNMERFHPQIDVPPLSVAVRFRVRR